MVPFFASPRCVVKIHTVQWTLGKIWWKSSMFFRDFHECPIFLAKGKDYFTSDFNPFSARSTWYIQRLPLIPIYWYCTCKIERQNLGSYFKSSHTPDTRIWSKSWIPHKWSFCDLRTFPSQILHWPLIRTYWWWLLRFLYTCVWEMCGLNSNRCKRSKLQGGRFSFRGLYVILSSYIGSMRSHLVGSLVPNQYNRMGHWVGGFWSLLKCCELMESNLSLCSWKGDETGWHITRSSFLVPCFFFFPRCKGG